MAEATTSVNITPQMMADAFWDMGTDEQAEFFAALNKVIQHDLATKPKSWAWGLGELQWYHLGDTLNQNKDAREMLMAMAAPLYLNTLRHAERSW